MDAKCSLGGLAGAAVGDNIGGIPRSREDPPLEAKKKEDVSKHIYRHIRTDVRVRLYSSGASYQHDDNNDDDDISDDECVCLCVRARACVRVCVSLQVHSLRLTDLKEEIFVPILRHLSRAEQLKVTSKVSQILRGRQV